MLVNCGIIIYLRATIEKIISFLCQCTQEVSQRPGAQIGAKDIDKVSNGKICVHEKKNTFKKIEYRKKNILDVSIKLIWFG